MRHIRSILYAVVLTPALWVLTAVGLDNDLSTRGHDRFAAESYGSLLLLLLAGLAYGIVLFAPISPAGPALGGLALLGTVLWSLNSPGGFASLWPTSVTKSDVDLSRPGYGLAAVLAVPLLCTALSARRWARYEPPVLPFIGQLGRARGTAPVAGIPAAVLTTTILPGMDDPDPADETTVLPLHVLDEPEPDDETTVLPRRPTLDEPEPGDDETTVLPLPAFVDDEPTTLLASEEPADEPASQEPASQEPASQEPAEEPDEADGELTQVVRVPGEHTRIIPQFTRGNDTGESTRVISLPGVPVELEHTQVIAPGIVAAPGERTQAIKSVPAQRKPEE